MKENSKKEAIQYLTRQELEFLLRQQVQEEDSKHQIGSIQQDIHNLHSRSTEQESKIHLLQNSSEHVMPQHMNKKENYLITSTPDLKEYELLLDSIQTQIWYYSDPYTYGLVNKAHADFMGLHKNHMIQARIKDILDTELAEQCIVENQNLFKNPKNLTISRWTKNAEGQNKLLNITKVPVPKGGQVEYLICSAQDITKYKMNQEILRDKMRQIKSSALIDSLTGIPNRRHLDEILLREWGRSLREKSCISLLMVDIDYFKAFNDHYGHPAGDTCLQKVARRLLDSVTRSSDSVARYGGEEFAVVLPRTESAGARLVGNKMCSQIQALQIEHAFSPAANVITVSIGGFSTQNLKNPKDLSVQTLLQKADQALYAAKNSGRNRVHCI